MKMCSTCKINKPLVDFSPRKSTQDGLHYYCKSCGKKATKKRQRTKDGLIGKIYFMQKRSSKKREMALPTYTKEWLINWMLSNPEFHRLYDIWAISGYVKNLIPSIDRIDDYLSYTEYNIQLMTWGENQLKASFDRKNGTNNKINKAVVQLTKKGKIIYTYHSIREASRRTNVDLRDISKCCNNKLKTTGGFTWKFKDEKKWK